MVLVLSWPRIFKVSFDIKGEFVETRTKGKRVERKRGKSCGFFFLLEVIELVKRKCFQSPVRQCGVFGVFCFVFFHLRKFLF